MSLRSIGGQGSPLWKCQQLIESPSVAVSQNRVNWTYPLVDVAGDAPALRLGTGDACRGGGCEDEEDGEELHVGQVREVFTKRVFGKWMRSQRDRGVVVGVELSVWMD